MSQSERLERVFPRLSSSTYLLTSPPDRRYNCIAWAAGSSSDWWQPDEAGWFYWPENAPRDYSLAAYIGAYESVGYSVCPSGDLEADIEKIALFVDEDEMPTHAARQLPSGRWTSKCGDLEDIEHDLNALEGEAYGRIRCFLSRAISFNTSAVSPT